MGAWETDDLCYKLFFEAGTQGMLLASTAGVLLDANPEACAILGYGREELLRTRLRSLVDTSDPRSGEVFGKGRLQATRKLGLRLLRRNGSPVEVEASLVQTADGSYDNMLGLVFRQRGEAGSGFRADPEGPADEVGRSARYVGDAPPRSAAPSGGDPGLRLPIEYGLDLILLVNPDNTIRYASPAVRRILGYEPEELVGVFVPTLLHPEEIQGATEAFEKSSRTAGPSEPLTLRSRHKDGRWVHLETAFTNLLADPAVGAIVVNGHDVTESARQQEELRLRNEELQHSVESLTARLKVAIGEAEDSEEMLRLGEEKWQALIRYASDLTVILDPDGTIRYESPAVERILGFGPEDRVGTNAFDHLHPDDAEPFRERLAELLERPDGRVSIEYREPDTEGVWHHFEAMGANLLDKPVVGGIVINTRDITERKRAENRLEAQYAVARVLEESTTLEAASSRVLQTVCELLAWDVGVFWQRDRRAGELRCMRTWYADAIEVSEFEAVTRETVFSRGEGFPGSVWASGQPAWISDITEAAGFQRASVARREGLHGGLAFPIILHGELLGVAEFFSFERRKPDAAVLETMETVGVQIGQFIERRRAENELREAERRYRTLIEQLPAVTYIRDVASTALTYVSPQLESVLGYSPKEYLADPGLYPQTIHPDDREWVLAEDERTDRTGEPHVVECRRITRDGRVVWVRDEAILVKDAEGRAQFWQGLLTDVTERKRSEVALRQSEELYRSVIEQAAENILLVDVETKRILEVNTALHASLGYTAEELSEMTLYDLVAHDRESVDLNIERVLMNGRYFIGERRYRHKDGSLIDVEVNVSAISYGGREAMCVVAHDVTERKAAEEGLRRSLEVLLALREAGQILGSTLESEEVVSNLLEIMRRVSNLVATVISVRNEDGSVLVWRSAGLENLWPRARFAPEAEAARRAVLEEETQQLFRIRRPHSMGEELTGLHLPLRVRDRVLGALEAYGTEELAAEETIELVGSLTSQAASALENALLYQDLAEREHRLQELVGQLLRTQEEERRRVAYEVHDGLAQVATAAHQRLQTFARRHPPVSQKAADDLARIVGLVHQTVGEARRIIGNLRPTALDDFGLAVAVSQALDQFRDEGWSVSCEENLGSGRLPGTIETALFRVAQEALTNARKHAGVHKVHVELLRENGNVRLRVSDEGRGFDPDSLVTAGPGERVGLAGMQERIALLGGRFELYSRPGEGTAITVDIPLRQTDEDGTHEQ